MTVWHKAIETIAESLTALTKKVESRNELLIELELLRLPELFKFKDYQDRKITPTVHDLDIMEKWRDCPVVISCWYAEIEDVYKVCAAVKAKFDCTYEMEEWAEAEKILFVTKIKGIKLCIQSLMTQGCEWKKEMREVTVLDCGGKPDGSLLEEGA